MAGHSKWKNIQHRKGRQDAKKGKIFTKITKEIFVAVRSGGDDPETNTALRLALQKAKQNNMPGSNVEQTIKKASGNVEGIEYEEIVYEGYGPGGTAVMVEVLTDNRNRTAAEMRHIFSKHGGNLGENGCVSFLFEKQGIIQIDLEANDVDEESLLMQGLEAGAEDVQVEQTEAEITARPEQYEQVRESLESEGLVISRSEVTQVPSTTVQLSGEDAREMMKLAEALEDNDDVQNVHANFDLDDTQWD